MSRKSCLWVKVIESETSNRVLPNSQLYLPILKWTGFTIENVPWLRGKESFYLFVHSFSKYFLDTCYVSNTVSGPGNRMVYKRRKYSAPLKLMSRQGRHSKHPCHIRSSSKNCFRGNIKKVKVSESSWHDTILWGV